jgi:hypothetical protein
LCYLCVRAGPLLIGRGRKDLNLRPPGPEPQRKSKLLNWLELPCATLSFNALPFALRRSATSPNAFSQSNKHVTRHVRRREDRLLRTSARMYFRTVRPEVRLIDYASRVAGVAIERNRSQAALQQAFEEVRKS